jgi:hypothetical protein
MKPAFLKQGFLLAFSLALRRKRKECLHARLALVADFELELKESEEVVVCQSQKGGKHLNSLGVRFLAAWPVSRLSDPWHLSC